MRGYRAEPSYEKPAYDPLSVGIPFLKRAPKPQSSLVRRAYSDLHLSTSPDVEQPQIA